MPGHAVRPFPGAGRALRAQAGLLPQPDQLCGPFAGHAALHAVLPAHAVPSLVELARSSATRIWDEDVAAWRPDGAAFDTTGWDTLARAASREHGGTAATALALALGQSGAAVVPVPSGGQVALADLLRAVAGAPYPVGVVANLRTGPVVPEELADWDVGHFVVLWGLVEAEPVRVGIADSYPEAGTPGLPAGCRLVTVAQLHAALTEPPGRGLLLLCRAGEKEAVGALVTDAGLTTGSWD